MMTKLNIIYMTLCAAVIVAGVAVHASHGPDQTALTGIEERGVMGVIDAVGGVR